MNVAERRDAWVHERPGALGGIRQDLADLVGDARLEPSEKRVALLHRHAHDDRRAARRVHRGDHQARSLGREPKQRVRGDARVESFEDLRGRERHGGGDQRGGLGRAAAVEESGHLVGVLLQIFVVERARGVELVGGRPCGRERVRLTKPGHGRSIAESPNRTPARRPLRPLAAQRTTTEPAPDVILIVTRSFALAYPEVSPPEKRGLS